MNGEYLNYIGSSQKVVGLINYAYKLVSLKRKNSIFLTPLNLLLKAFIFALKDSAEALVLLLSKYIEIKKTTKEQIEKLKEQLNKDHSPDKIVDINKY